MFSKNKLFKSLSTCAAFSILSTNFLQAKGSATLNNTKSTLNSSKPVGKKHSNKGLKSKKVISQNKTFNLNTMIDGTLLNDGEDSLNDSRPVAKKGRSHKKVKNKRSVAQNKTFNLNKIINDVSKFLGHLNFNKIINDIYKFASSPLVYPSLLTFPPVLLAILLSSDGNNSKNKKNNKKLPNKPSEKELTDPSSSRDVNGKGSGKSGNASSGQKSPGEYEKWSEEDRDFLVGCLVIFFIVAAVLFLIFKPNRLPSESELDKWKVGFIDDFGRLYTDISDLNKNKNKGNNILKNINKFKKVFYKRVANGNFIKERANEQEKFIPDSVFPEENKEIKEEYGINEDKYKYKDVYKALPVLDWDGCNCSVLSAFYLMYSPEYKYFYCILRALCETEEELLLKCLDIVLENESTKTKKPFLFSEIGHDRVSVFKKFKDLGEEEQKELLKFYIQKKLGGLDELPKFKDGEDYVKMENRVIGNLKKKYGDEKIGFGTYRGGRLFQVVDTIKCFGFFLGNSGGELDSYTVEEFKGIEEIGEFFTNAKILNIFYGATSACALLGEKKEDKTLVIKQCDETQGDEDAIYLRLDREKFIDGPLPVNGHCSIGKETWDIEGLKKEFPEIKFNAKELFEKFKEDEKNYYKKIFSGDKNANPKKYNNYTENQYVEEKIKESREKFDEQEIKNYIDQGYCPISVVKQLVRKKIQKEKNINLSDNEYEKMWSDDTVFFLKDNPGRDIVDPQTGKIFYGADNLPVLGKSVTVNVRKKRDDEKGRNFGYGEQQKVYIAAISIHEPGHWSCFQPKYKWDSKRGEYVISRWVRLSCSGGGHKFYGNIDAWNYILEKLRFVQNEAGRKNILTRVITQEEIEACPEYYIMDEEGNMGKEKDIRPGALEENKVGYIPPEWRAVFKNYEENGATTQGEKNENNINNEFDINTNSN